MNQQTTINTAPAIGQPCLLALDNIAYVANVSEPCGKVYSLFEMAKGEDARLYYDVTVITQDGVTHNINEKHFGFDKAARANIQPVSASFIEQLQALSLERQNAERLEREKREAAQALANAELQKQIDAIRPSWVQSCIIATMQHDKCDSMSDYFHVSDGRAVLIGWSKHKRNLFPELRKAAAAFEETAALAEAGPDAEHRENYSMGAGTYLKDGSRYDTGWQVKKECYHAIDKLAYHIDEIAPALLQAPQESAATPAAPIASSDGARFTIEKHVHTKKGFDMYICIMSERVEREQYMALLSEAKALGGWYSRAWGGTPAGFAFKRLDAAETFAGCGDHGGDKPSDKTDSKTQSAPLSKPAGQGAMMADKLDALAQGMDSAIEKAFAPRESNTPKRARIAAEARNDGFQLQRAKVAMLALAGLWRAGNVPAVLQSVTTKKAILNLTMEQIDYSGGYYDAGVLTGNRKVLRDAKEDQQSAALWDIIAAQGADDSEQRAAQELQDKIAALQFANIPGYFPTPQKLIDQMLDRAGIDGRERVLEPSAGSGAIADSLKTAGCYVDCVEPWGSLRDILDAKGHNVIGRDIMDLERPAVYDAVIMNPPFEKGQDVQHVMQAMQFLKDGGVLVAIMSAGVNFRTDKAYANFRAFVDVNGGEIVDNPADSFKESGTGVNTVMAVLTKGASA